MAPFWRENQLVQTPKKKKFKGELMIWRTKMLARVQEARSNSRIQFASNESKLVLRNLNHGPPSKVGFIPTIQELKWYCNPQLVVQLETLFPHPFRSQGFVKRCLVICKASGFTLKSETLTGNHKVFKMNIHRVV